MTLLARSMLCCLLAASACKRGPEPVPVRPAPATIGRVASAAAFDLVGAADGPLLLWAPPREAGAALMMRALDAFGRARAPARRIAVATSHAEVSEVAAAALGAQVGVAFIETDASEARTRAMLFSPAEQNAPDPTAIASSAAEQAQGRGRLAVAAVGTDTFRILYPAGKADCVETEQAPCTGFGFRELGAGAREPRGPWLSVPQPCPEGAASVAGLPGRWFYAVCSWARDAPLTMAYSINVDTYYARADEVLRGCTPLGMLAIGGSAPALRGGASIDAQSVLLGADCDTMRRAAQFTLDMKAPAEFPLDDVRVACDGDRASIQATGWSLALDAPRDRLEVVLPATLAPTGARAIWTGHSLLVAHRQGEELELVRYECLHGMLHAARSAPSAAAN